jgi:hypothetical protein
LQHFPLHLKASALRRISAATRYSITGRIIAAADSLRPARDRNSPDRQSLLPLRETDLGDQLWKIDVDYRTGPTLLINGTIPGFASKLREQALLQGLVLPPITTKY